MALINGIYVFVQDETVDYSVEISSHPVEKGIDISDHARTQPYVINLSGEIVGTDAAQKRAQVEALLTQKALITYQGRNVKYNGMIETFSTGHPNTIYGGCSFEMTIKEIRVANSGGYIGNTTPTQTSTTPLKDTQHAGTQSVDKQNSNEETYTLKNGDSVYDQSLNTSNSYANVLATNKNVDPETAGEGDKITIPRAGRGYVGNRATAEMMR